MKDMDFHVRTFIQSASYCLESAERANNLKQVKLLLSQLHRELQGLRRLLDSPEPSRFSEVSPKRKEVIFVLIVDDNEINLMLLNAMLGNLGMTIEKTQSAEKAIEMTRKFQFDCIFLDIAMPEMNGIEAIRLIREKSEYQTIPIVAVSAHNDPETKEAAQKAGFNFFLTKPINKNMIMDLLNQISP